MTQLVIVGAGGHGKVVADIAESIGCYSGILFIDDAVNSLAEGPLGYPIAGGLSKVSMLGDADVVVAIGDGRVRRRVSDVLEKDGRRIVSLVHPSAAISRHAVLGRGTVVMPGAVVGPDVRIGAGVIVNTSASIDHDCVVGDYAHISVGSHLAGGVCIGENTWIGIGAAVINNVSVCSDVTVGAGAAVVRDVLDAGTYVGVPARKLVPQG